METLEAQMMMIEMDRKLWSGWKSRTICRPALSALQLLDVVTLQRHFSFNISRMSGVLFGERERESVVFSRRLPLRHSLPPSLVRPPHPNALSILLSHSLFPSTFILSFLTSPFSIPVRLKVYDSRMWSHTSPNIFNHTIKCHHFFSSFLPEAISSPALRGLRRNLTHRCDPSSFITVFLQTHFCSVLFSPSIQTFVWAPEMLESKSSECFRICFHMFPSCFLCSPEWRCWWRTRRHAGYLNAVCFMFTFFSVILSNKCIWAWDVGPAK